MSKIYFTADTHFGHINILRFCSRPYTDIQDHDEKLVANWNSVVKPGDTVYHLGDFAWHPNIAGEVLNKLNGNIHLIEGNHEGPALTHRRRFGWTMKYYEMRVEDPDGQHGWQHMVLFHYPIRSWNRMRHGAWHLYGHCHGSLTEPLGKAIDIGIDCWDYKPVSYEQIKQRMNQLSPVTVDGHE